MERLKITCTLANKKKIGRTCVPPTTCHVKLIIFLNYKNLKNFKIILRLPISLYSGVNMRRFDIQRAMDILFDTTINNHAERSYIFVARFYYTIKTKILYM